MYFRNAVPKTELLKNFLTRRVLKIVALKGVNVTCAGTEYKKKIQRRNGIYLIGFIKLKNVQAPGQFHGFLFYFPKREENLSKVFLFSNIRPKTAHVSKLLPSGKHTC